MDAVFELDLFVLLISNHLPPNPRSNTRICTTSLINAVFFQSLFLFFFHFLVLRLASSLHNVGGFDYVHLLTSHDPPSLKCSFRHLFKPPLFLQLRLPPFFCLVGF
jgi:hypothetical protein